MTRLVAIGGSLGGYDAVTCILRGLAPDPGPPVAIVLHRGPSTSFSIADRLARETGCAVSEVLDGRPTERGHVYLAPADYHLLVDRNHLSLSIEGLAWLWGPSSDRERWFRSTSRW